MTQPQLQGWSWHVFQTACIPLTPQCCHCGHPKTREVHGAALVGAVLPPYAAATAAGRRNAGTANAGAAAFISTAVAAGAPDAAGSISVAVATAAPPPFACD